MRKNGTGKRLLALMMSAAMLMPSMSALASDTKSAGAEQVYAEEAAALKEGTGREQVNFNRGWKFIRSDVEGAEAVSYDDSAWVDVGIPHNFSIPYEMAAQFYVGYGWYRKAFEVPEEWKDKKVELEFEGVFQEAEIYVNGQKAGTHRGGYSGFVYDITDYLHTGTNLVAVRVNNIWQHDLAPRAGDHQFTGGIYRDVYLNVTEDVHVAWYGTYVTTPDLTNPGFDESAANIDVTQFPTEEELRANLSAKRSNVRVQTEVVNDSAEEKDVQVFQKVTDAEGKTVAEFASETAAVAAGETAVLDAVSPQITGIQLWSPEHPYLYKVSTTVTSGGAQTDTYESTFGFRWAQYKHDGFYLNGEKVLLDGANAHQDHAGFADAVTDEGLYRDAAMIKECGMNFIRGSHYPHDPSYAKACDELGILFWSECNFWGMGGCGGKDGDATMNASDWFKDAYPQNPEDEEAFEDSCLESLEAMIRMNRNHPSIINWSMGNEVFFTASGTQNKAKALVNKMRNRAHELDPTRKAGMGGCQREGYDSLEVCDIAGYNGDGGKFENNWMPNVVAEYGSKVQDRPGEYRPYYDQIQGSTEEEYTLKTGSAGLSLWCAFHHGTIGGDGLAKMGIIDYYRLPLNSWYWYREKNTGVAREASVSGTAERMEITASDMEITNDGKKDTKLTVTMLDQDGRWVNDMRTVTLTVKEGPGIFPGGKTYTFTPNKSMRDGKASIEFRSFYQGTTVISAEAEGLPEATITLQTSDTTGADNGEEPENFYDASLWGTLTEKIEEPFAYGSANAASGRPVFPSSNAAQGELAADGNPETSWVAEKTGNGEYFLLDLEFVLYLYKVKLGFSGVPYPYTIETAMDKNGPWTEAAAYTGETVGRRMEEETLNGVEARYVKVTFTEVPEGEKAFLSEIEVYGNVSAQAPQYVTEGVYLSEGADYDAIATGWGEKGKNVSCEGSPISIGGKHYEKGIGLHANSSIPYETAGKYSRITGVAGIDNEVSGGNALFRIYADNKLIYEKELSGGDADEFNLSISGVQKLRLETDANGNDSQDHTDWADVKLLGAVRDVSLKESGLAASWVGMTSGLHAGEACEGIYTIENTGKTAKNVELAAVLYGQDGKLLKLAVQSVKAGAEKKSSVDVKMDMPGDITGYHLELLAWEKGTLAPLANRVCLYADPAYLTKEDGGSISWEKTDGEDASLKKEGTWKNWPSNDAYKGTETYNNPSESNSSISYEFTGQYVRIGAKVDSSQVGADVYLDGVKAGTCSTTAADTSTNVYREVWASEKLGAGTHTVKLVPIGKFGLDYIEVGTEETVSEKEEEEYVRGLKDACARLLETAFGGNLTAYTDDSRCAAAAALAEACSILVGENPTEEACSQAAEKLAKALVLKEEPPKKADLTELNAAIREAEGKREGDYTAESWADFRKALAAAKEAAAKEGVSQEDADQARSALQKALASLKEKEEPLTPPEKTQPEKPSVDKPQKGDIIKTSGGRYQIISPEKKTAKLVSVTNRKAKKLSVPSTVKQKGITYKVTVVGERVMKGNKKLVTVTLGKNIALIEKQAFAGCKNLKSMQLKGKALKTIRSGAFQKTSSKMVVSAKKMSRKQKLLLAKKMRKAGMSKKGKVK